MEFQNYLSSHIESFELAGLRQKKVWKVLSAGVASLVSACYKSSGSYQNWGSG